MFPGFSGLGRFGWAVLTVALAVGNQAAGQSLPFGALNVVHWGVDQGLAPGPVNTAIQTRDGYLWFGTDDGLARFDGVRTRIFDSRNTPALRSSRISALFEDHSGALWIGTKGGGLVRFSQGEFALYDKESGLTNEQVTAVCEDAGGAIWVGTDGGGLYHLTGGRFRRWGLDDPWVKSLAADLQGRVFVAYGSSLTVIQGENVQRFTATNGLDSYDVIALYRDARGVIWIGGTHGIWTFENGKFTKLQTEEPVDHVESICGAADGSIWLGTVDGLVHLKGERIARYSIQDGLSGKIEAGLLCDREGSLWVGNEAPGIDQMRPTRFMVYSTAQGLAHEITTSIYQDRDGAVWIGSHGGLNCLRDGRITRFTTRDGLSGNLVLSVYGDHDGAIWVGTLSGLNRFKDGKFQVYSTREGLPAKEIWCIYCDREGVVWVGTHKGLVRVEHGRFKVLNFDNAGLSHNDVRSICEDPHGELWVGTSYGLNHLRGDHFQTFVDAAPGVVLEIVYTLYVDDDGVLWIGTDDHGLVRYKGGKFFRYSFQTGLPDDTIFQILEDNQQNLWMTSDHGVFKVSRKELNAVAEGRAAKISPQVFGKADGLLSAECTGSIQPAGWKASDGRLWFPTAKGAAVIDPRNDSGNQVVPLVRVESITADGKEMPLSPIAVVPPGGEQIQIRYTALSFVVPGQVRFKYQLEGLDRDWVDAAERRDAFYSHVPPGQYRFKVKACNNDGVWNEAGATVALTVQPFYWQTETFRAAVASAAIAATALFVWWFARARHRRQISMLAQQHALELERTRIARDMHDGVGASLVKISLLGEIIEGQLTPSDQNRKQVHRITVAARNAVRDMDEIVWAVNPKNDTLENLANYICQFAREHFADTRVQCDLDIPVELPPWPLTAEVRHNLFLAIKEALNNVLKHARASRVGLQVALNGRELQIRIEDDGRGCTPDESKGLGDGLENMQKRLQDIGGRLEWASQPGKGTTIFILARLEAPPVHRPDN